MLATIGLLATLAVGADDPIQNADFETRGSKGNPVPGWVIELGATNGAKVPESTVEVDRDVRHGGRSSLHFSGDGSTRGWLIVKQRIPVRPGGRYHLRSWVKAQGVVPNGFGVDNCYVALLFFDAEGSVVGKRYTVPRLPDSDWKELDTRLTATSNAREGWVYVFLSMIGDLWIDDLELEIKGGEELPQLETVLEEDFVKARRLPSKWKKEVGATNGTGGRDSGIEVDPEVGAEGSPRSLKLSGDADTMRWHMVKRELKAASGELYRFRALVKAEDVHQEGVQYSNLHLSVAFLDRRGETLGPVKFAQAGTGTFDWKEVVASGVAPEGTKKVRAGIFLSMSGAAWFDDLLLQRQEGNDPPYSDWDTIETKKVILRYSESHPAAKQMKQYALRLDQAKDEICRQLEVEFPEKITVFIYKDDDEGQMLTGANLDFANPGGRAVHQKLNSYIAHEMVHVIAHTRLGNGQTGILGEGVAVWLNGQTPAAHHRRAAELLLKGELPSVANLISQFRSESAGYPASGSFCGYLLQAHGLEFFKQIYPLKDPSAKLKELVGESFEEMEKGWHEELQKYR